MNKERNNGNNLTQEKFKGNLELTDFDVCELVISCHKVFIETASKLDIEKEVAFENGNKLWKETLRTLKEYRESNRKTS